MNDRSLPYFALIIAALTTGWIGPVHAGESQSSDPSVFDPALAERLGADAYGMRSYVLVILTTGPSDVTDPDRRKEIFAGHFKNMARMAEAGQLLLAGPLLEALPKRGLFVLNVDDLEAARLLVETDPAVAAGIFDYELAKWYGSAAVMMTREIHQRVQAMAIE